MLFKDFSGPRDLIEAKVVSFDRVVNNTLLKHVFSSSKISSASVARDRNSHCTVGLIGILARHGLFASFSGPVLRNHNHVAHT